ncbi:MAG: hypothetical protein AAFX04_13255 [Pseudomonadota bacterium]
MDGICDAFGTLKQKASTMKQLQESDDTILIAIIDETYQEDETSDDIEDRSEEYRLELERQFGAPFQEGDIGPSASIPAFLTEILSTQIPLWSLLAGTFFLGKPINENLDAWKAIGKKIHSFFSKPVVLSRNGAAIIAVEAVFEYLGQTPRSIRLVSYRPESMPDADSLGVMERDDHIAEAPDTLFIGFVQHVFEIEADNKTFRVGVAGKEVEIILID